MEDRKSGSRKSESNDLGSRLRDVEQELKSLRAAVYHQIHTNGQVHAAIAALEAHLKPAPAPVPAPNAFEKRVSSWYLSAAKTLLRADVEDLFDREYYISRASGLKPALLPTADPVRHFLRTGGAVSPHWLFDRDFYLRTYPDVAASGVNPLVHFLRSGWREGRDPHSLFRTSYYLEQAPELLGGKLNPLSHYLETGWRAGLRPHPLFDGAYYLKRYPDIGVAGMNPLTHYVLFGADEGRHPHEWFDSTFYRQRNPDVATARVEPIRHYIEYGDPEGRDPHPLFDTAFYREEVGPTLQGISSLEHFVRYGRAEKRSTVPTDRVDRFLPAQPAEPPPPRNRSVDIVVPVYRGLQETRACIESVLAAPTREPYELIVIDDRSPEPALSAWLAEASAAGRFTLLINSENLGFVATVNRGMELHPERDVLLLNSDTTVANNWLDRLVRCAYSNPRGGTVTPLSNNATICSYPRFCEDNPLPQGTTAAELDRLAAEVNAGRSVAIPTAVGFCMYIRRDCLLDTGLFDAEVFGKGYGEENDFSLRAAAKGWLNLLAADTFVYHAGSISFAKGAVLLRERGVRALTGRYPKYLSLIARHVARDPALPFRFALTAARYCGSPHPTILLVTHDLGGGIGQHIQELVKSQRGRVNFLELQPGTGSQVLLKSADPADGFSLTLDGDRQYGTLVALLRSCNLSRMHVHSVLHHSLPLEKLQHDLNIPVEFTVHDYLAICPRFVLAKPDGRYCEEPEESGCNECIRTTLPHLNVDIGSWRAKYSWLLNSADRVIAPSVDTASRMSRRFPAARLLAVTHPLQPAPANVSPPRLSAASPLRIAVLGVMSHHKGLANLEACARIAQDRELPLEFSLIGYCEPQVRAEGPFCFTETGEYAREDLEELLTERDPGLVWFPMRWPETFSYTLTACLERGLPVAAPQLGALPERLSARAWTWIYDWSHEPEQLIELFLQVRESLVSGAAPQPTPGRPQAEPNFYSSRYRATALEPAPPVDLREPGRLSIAAMLSAYDSGQMQSCGYIRAYLPLMRGPLESRIRLTVTTPESALRTIADVFLVQRTAVSTLALAQELVRHCERERIRLVYETDDDLFNIHVGHTDSAHYTPLIAPAELIARHAAAVLVSSPVLQRRVAPLNANTLVLPNALDEALWFAGKKPMHAPSKTVRILYMGTMTHSRDLEILEEPMRMLKSEFGAGVELDLIGIMPEGEKRDWFNVRTVPAIYGHSYPLFIEWLRQQNNWDFGVAPLVDDEFNRCKSYIKYLDYGALGIPGIFSGIGIFEEIVRQGETGLVVPDAASWYTAMRLLITDAKLRRAMGHAAYRDVEANHTLAAQTAMRNRLWNQIGSLPAVRSSSTIVSFSEETAATSSKGL